MHRTHDLGQLTKKNDKEKVKVAGWIDTIRDHGGITFVDLRDHYGTIQLVFDEKLGAKIPTRESVISVEGAVRLRTKENINPKIPTGDIEVVASNIYVHSVANNQLPFEVAGSTSTKEELRLKYRFLDLRNPVVHNNIVLRSKIISTLRKEMENLGFLEFQTPILTSSSPEGARDYIVPSRKHKGKFYALPQAPQIFKQLLMVSGFDRYFQIAPCFRDEDARADRSPGEFYQLDFEMAFATQEDVFKVAEQVMYNTFTKFSKKPVSKPPFTKFTYAEAMMKYGSDKPDMRNPLLISDLSKFFSGVEFAAFKNKSVRGIAVPKCGEQPRRFFDKMVEFALSLGMKGLGYITIDEEGLKGPIAKFLSEKQQKELVANEKLKKGDAIFFISGDNDERTSKFAGAIRNELGKRLELLKDTYEFCYVLDFPMFGIDEETGKIGFTHNPFSMPQGELDAILNKNPLDILAYQYDIVCNGVELSSGAVRNHKPEIMEKAFEIAGYTKDVLTSKFPALYNAFHYGAPPHAGMAPGVDRIVMLLGEQENIREVICFPMNSSAQDLLLGAPGEVTEQQLRDTHIKIR